MKHPIEFQSAYTLFALTFAIFHPGIAYGLAFDYAIGRHAVAIEYSNGSHAAWGESTADSPPFPTSFNFSGSGNLMSVHEPFPGHINMGEISRASAVFGDASIGKMGVKAEVVNPSGNVTALVQNAGANVQIGGAFIIDGPAGTVNLKVRTTLDGMIGMALNERLNSMPFIRFEMNAASQAFSPGTYQPLWNSSAGWSVSSLVGNDMGGYPIQNPGLYFQQHDDMMGYTENRISPNGDYTFNNSELILNLYRIETNQRFNLDLFLDAQIAGPGFAGPGTTGDKVDFYSTYSMGFANNKPEQWFELPAGYSISTAEPIPEPETWAMLLAGLGLVGFAARHRKQVKA